MESSLNDVNPLLVRMRVRRRASAGRHAHQRNDHAFALDAWTRRRCVVRTAVNFLDRRKIEAIFLRCRTSGAGRLRGQVHLMFSVRVKKSRHGAVSRS